jgi:hypothetical protein
MADLQIEKGSGAKPNVTFYSDGTPTDLDGVCTVTLLKPDGTAGPASGAVTHVGAAGSGKYEFTLGSQPELIWYDITWAGLIGGVVTSVTTHVEVVGAFLFTVASLRDTKVAGSKPFNATDFPNSMVLDRRAQVTDDFEAKTGYSFVPRFAREVFDGAGQGSLILRKYLCQRLLSVTIDGVAQTATDYILADTGLLTSKFGWTFSSLAPQNVAVEYVYGWDRPPAEVSDAGLARAAMLLLPSQLGSAAVTVNTPDGNSYSYDQAGQSFGGGRRYYGIPKIDSVLSDPAYNARRGGVFA